jgi:transcriptional regulator with XRE-family HTH domain
MTTQPLNLIIGLALKEIREKKNIKQEWVAEKIGLTKANYSKIESGKIKRIDLNQLNHICNIYGISAFHIILYSAMKEFKYKINSFDEFYESLKQCPPDERKKMLMFVDELLMINKSA